MKRAIVWILMLCLLTSSALAATSTLRPRMNAYVNDWVGVPFDGTYEWMDVRDTNTTSYVYDSGTSAKSFYYVDFFNESMDITEVRYCFEGRRNAPQEKSVRFGFNFYGGESWEYTWTLGSSWSENCMVFTENPGTGVDWYPWDINNMAIGIDTNTTRGGGQIAWLRLDVIYN